VASIVAPTSVIEEAKAAGSSPLPLLRLWRVLSGRGAARRGAAAPAAGAAPAKAPEKK
jgi:hypothetical protein